MSTGSVRRDRLRKHRTRTRNSYHPREPPGFVGNLLSDAVRRHSVQARHADWLKF